LVQNEGSLNEWVLQQSQYTKLKQKRGCPSQTTSFLINTLYFAYTLTTSAVSFFLAQIFAKSTTIGDAIKIEE
jgi:uncharacterized membrane protein (DUF485 family)